MVYSDDLNQKRPLANLGTLFIAMDNSINKFDLMQFTGLKDKNGKEIYADDILFDGERKFRVYAMYGGFGIKAPHWSGIMEDMVMGDDLIMQPLADAQTMSYVSQSMEVIGNIYENPELLNK